MRPADSENVDTEKPQLNVSEQDRVSFHRAEWDALKREIEIHVRQANENVRWAVLATGASYGLIFGSSEQPAALLTHWLVWFPVALSALLGLHSLGLYKQIDNIRGYLLKLEAAYAAPGLGWEGWLQVRWIANLGIVHVVFWCALVAAASFAALAFSLLSTGA